jgi:hypothetical protein
MELFINIILSEATSLRLIDFKLPTINHSKDKC